MIQSPNFFAGLGNIADHPLRPHADELLTAIRVCYDDWCVVGLLLIAFFRSHLGAVCCPNGLAGIDIEGSHELPVDAVTN